MVYKTEPNFSNDKELQDYNTDKFIFDVLQALRGGSDEFIGSPARLVGSPDGSGGSPQNSTAPALAQPKTRTINESIHLVKRRALKAKSNQNLLTKKDAKVSIERVVKAPAPRKASEEVAKPNTLSLEAGMQEVYQARRTGRKSYRDVFDKFFINALIKLKVNLGPGNAPRDVVYHLYGGGSLTTSRVNLPPDSNTYMARLLYYIFHTETISLPETTEAWMSNFIMPKNSSFLNFEKESFFQNKKTKNFFRGYFAEPDYHAISFYGNFNIKENLNLVTQDVFIDNAGNLIANLKFSMTSVSFLKLLPANEGGFSIVFDYFFFIKEGDPSKGFFIKKSYRNGSQENSSNFKINHQSETNMLKSENNQTIQLENMNEYRSEIESMTSFISEVLELEGAYVYILPKKNFSKEVLNNESYSLKRHGTGVFYKVEEVK
jgi:hypothetical protein